MLQLKYKISLCQHNLLKRGIFFLIFYFVLKYTVNHRIDHEYLPQYKLATLFSEH
jgi:hypothetical protein